MAASPIFDLFEMICSELAERPQQVISETDLEEALLQDLRDHFRSTSDASAFTQSLAEIEIHLAARGAAIPYAVELPTREFEVVDGDYIDYVAFARNHRGVGGNDSKEFEIRTLRRLRRRFTGDLHRVGVPRDLRRRKREIVEYLEGLGFDSNCLESRDQDGGLDILWLPPLGAVPLRPVVSLQCKNSFFSEDEANASTGRAQRTLHRHSHLRSDHLKFVVFNDYIDSAAFVGRAVGWTFMPLGLTDLAEPAGQGIDDIL